ncbi:MAG: hypothetical protein MHMPM18_000048 [Marteilia pararefringens]
MTLRANFENTGAASLPQSSSRIAQATEDRDEKHQQEDLGAESAANVSQEETLGMANRSGSLINQINLLEYQNVSMNSSSNKCRRTSIS